MASTSPIMGDINDEDLYDEQFQREHDFMLSHQGKPCPNCDAGSLDYHHCEHAEALMWFKCYKCGNMHAEVMEWM